MPASVADPLQLVLRTALTGKKSGYGCNDEDDKVADQLEDRLAASAKRVLLTTIEYEPAPKQQVLALDSLKSKYTVLNATSQSSKMGSLNGHNSQITSLEGLPAPKVTLFRYEDVKIGWKGSVPVGAGMINMGNTCYMNSTLQALLHVPSFANWLAGGRHCKNCDPGGSQLCTICVISKTLHSTHEKSGGVTKPILVYNRLKMICKHMVHGRQEDAHEFMRYLIESMEKAYLHSIGASKLDTRSKETNPLGQIFGGYIRTEVTCLKCKHISTTFQHFQDIPLDIQHASTLEENLAHYFRREKLDGDNAYKCDKCKSKVAASKKFSIERAPNVLCIQLKRFNLMGGKMSKHIQFPRQLNLNRFLFNQQPGASASPPAAYKFVSLINHMGPSQHCGHYTAIAEAANGQLYLFDDCSVRLITLHSALSTGAYVLIYERLHSASPAIQSKLNGLQPSTKLSTSAAAPAPTNATSTASSHRPGVISEPSRPKINFEVKKQTDASQKAVVSRLVIRNGSQSLFKSATPLNANGSSAATATAPLTSAASTATNLVLKPTPIPATTTATTTTATTTTATTTTATTTTTAKPALVPYDNESDDDDDEVARMVVPSRSTNGSATASSAPLLKATEPKWQVSPSPTPSDTNSSTSANGTSVSKWQVSANNLPDGNNSSSSVGSNSNGTSNWVVRSLSDTESEKAKTQAHRPAADHNCHSDTETNACPPTGKSTPTLVRIGNKFRLIGETFKAKLFGPSVDAGTKSSNGLPATDPPTSEVKDEHKEVSSESVATVESSKQTADAEPNGTGHLPATSETKTVGVVDSSAADDQRSEAKTVLSGANSQTADLTSSTATSSVKTNGKGAMWDGSRKGGVVKDLLRMSHSGFDDQVRTWDGGKSHVTKQVEDDKRIQRKRTADELYDEDMDRGKLKKVKNVNGGRETSPPPRTANYNPFQMFQNARNRVGTDSGPHQHNTYKSDYHKNKYKHHHAGGGRFNYHAGGGGREGHGRGRSDGHRPSSNNQRPWKRFR